MEELKSNSITMDTLKHLLLMQLKPYDHTKNAQTNSLYLSLLKKISKQLLQSTILINLARLIEIWKIKNKPSNNRNSYYLIDDSTDITNSQSAILTIMNIPIVKKMSISTIL